jgi:hypothetical protein
VDYSLLCLLLELAGKSLACRATLGSLMSCVGNFPQFVPVENASIQSRNVTHRGKSDCEDMVFSRNRAVVDARSRGPGLPDPE